MISLSQRLVPIYAVWTRDHTLKQSMVNWSVQCSQPQFPRNGRGFCGIVVLRRTGTVIDQESSGRIELIFDSLFRPPLSTVHSLDLSSLMLCDPLSNSWFGHLSSGNRRFAICSVRWRICSSYRTGSQTWWTKLDEEMVHSNFQMLCFSDGVEWGRSILCEW